MLPCLRCSRTMAVAAAVVAACAGSAPAGAPQPVIPSLDYTVVHQYPHDPDAFTQGLVFRDGALYESTGRNGHSSLRKVRLETGEVLQRVDVPNAYFAEGLALSGKRLLQLTWRSNVGFVYDLSSFARRGTFDYKGEGWGLTTDAARLIMSDGTPTLRFLDPASLTVVGTLAVTDDGEPLGNINELEMVNGVLFANVWLTDRIVRIDPKTGVVTGHLDLDRLHPPERAGQTIDVLNGIAYDSASGHLLVTGKLWPTLYEIAVEGLTAGR